MNMFSGENLWPDYEGDFGTPPTVVPSYTGSTTEVHALPSQEGSFILSLDEAAPGFNHHHNNGTTTTTQSTGSNTDFR